jgi:hypothetical protein
MRATYGLEGKLWKHPGAGGWHFLTLPEKEAREIRERFGGGPGWGSIRVRVRIGKTAWDTSVFPDKKSGSYLLPLKAAARRSEGLDAGDAVRYRVEVER